MADEKALGAIDEDSKAMLEDHVKKGKARKFILITKGSMIKSLIVFKKGPYGPKVNKAKKDGFRGEATCGVITGKGVNIMFQLPGNADVFNAMKTEGNICDGEPCKIAKLRTFFKDEAELKFKPEFQIVTSVDDVAVVSELDDESEWSWRLKELTPKLKMVLERKQGDFGQVAAVFKQAQAAQPTDIGNAVERLKECGRLVDLALRETEGEWADATPDDYREAWTSASAEFPIQRQQAATALSADQMAKFDALVQKANDLAKQGEFQAAVEIALRIADIAAAGVKKQRETERADVIPENVIEQRKFLATRWKQIPVEFKSELDILRKRFEKDIPQRNAAGLCAKIESYLQELFDKAQIEIDDASSAGDASMLKGLSERVLGDRAVDLLVNDPVVACTNLEAKIVDTLGELEASLVP